jgi:pilus assembly protein CpaB
MKNNKALLMIVLSVVLGLGAVIAATRWMSRQSTMPTSKVVVANIDIDLGTPLTLQMMKVVDWPMASVPLGTVDDTKKLDARVVKTSLLRGEAILQSKLAPIGSTGGLSAVISKGNRAMTVRVNDVVGVAGFALPGNFVDIVVNTEDESIKAANVNKSISKIVLEHILVLAIAQEQGRDETKPKVVSAVTLEVTPEQAEKLDLARSVGNLSLVLRNQVDTSLAATSGSTKNNLFSHPDQKLDLTPIPIEDRSENKDKGNAEIKTSPRKSSPKKLTVKLDQVEVVRGDVKSVEQFKPYVD